MINKQTNKKGKKNNNFIKHFLILAGKCMCVNEENGVEKENRMANIVKFKKNTEQKQKLIKTTKFNVFLKQ